ncbi:ATP-binding protein [Cryptosporangium aurantiacum]|nr:ATP-binding protein [Cryptosporangium aurantiacum]
MVTTLSPEELSPQRLDAVRRAEATLSAGPIAMDAVARTAARVANAPAGLVSLVGDEWDDFVGVHGVSDDLIRSPRIEVADSLCRNVVVSAAPVVIPDTLADPRSRDAAAVPDLAIGAYAGVPLRGRDDQVVGAICALASHARDWTPEQVAALTGVAETVSLLPGVAAVSAELTAGMLDPPPLLDALAEAFVAVDADGAVLAWNTAAEALFGWTLEEVVGRPLCEVVFPDAMEQVQEAVRESAADDRPGPRRRRTVWATTRSGDQRPIDATFSVVPGRHGPVTCVSMLDLSDRVTAEADASRQKSFLRALLDSMDTGVFAGDAHGRTLFANTALRRMLGVTDTTPLAESTVARNVLWHPDGTRLHPTEYPSAQAISGRHVRDLDLDLRIPGRPVRHLMINAEPIQVGDARLGAVVVLHDVTAQRRAQRLGACDLAVYRALLAAPTLEAVAPRLVEAVASALGWRRAELWLTDPVGDVLRPTASWVSDETGTGVPHQAPTGSLGADEDLPGAAWAAGAPVWIDDLTTTGLRAPDQRLRTGLAVPVGSADHVVGVLALYTDLPDPDQEAVIAHLAGIAAYLGQYLERCRTEELALQLARTKDEYLALVGHELRTPLTSIATYAQLLADSPDTWATDGPQLLAVIQRNTAVLMAIIDDLLDLAGLESGHIALEPVDVDFAALVRDRVETIGSAADAAGLTLSVDVPEALPLHGDPERLRQMLDNLLSNAVKYNRDGGSVTVRVTVRDATAVLTVADTGTGVPADEHGRLFQQFFRSAETQHSGMPGSGLGLVVTRTIVERHGGRITTTDNDPGLVVTVELPLGE